MEWRCGADRMVVLMGELAFKFPKATSWKAFLHGLLANMQEAFWNQQAKRSPHVDPDHRLAPVLFAIPGGWLLVMRRADAPKNFHRKFSNNIERLRPLFAGLPYDQNPDNFGFIGRRLVLIDYGS